MARPMHKLSAAELAKLDPGLHGDGGGLWLQVTPARRSGAPDLDAPASRSWILRYARKGKPVWMGLGPLSLVPLTEARRRATAARKLLLDGIDPREHRRAAEAAATPAPEPDAKTFEWCADQYITAHEGDWRNPKHRDQWRASLKRYAYPHFGSLAVSAVDRDLVLKVLDPIWNERRETARRVRGRIETVLDWASARGFRDGDNPARWRGGLASALPSKGRRVRHQPALPYLQIPGFMKELRSHRNVSAWALEFTILTAARTGEVIGAVHDEFDMPSRLWTIPANRMKAGREHRVPLHSRAAGVYLDCLSECRYAFPGARGGEPLSNMAMLELLRGMRPGMTVHGFRSTFRDWAAEKGNYPEHVVEAALAHTVKDKVEAAYRRGDLFEKRRELMSAWADYCYSG